MAKEMQIAFEGPMLAELAEQLAAELGAGKREGKVFNKHMLQALKESMKPGVAELKRVTPKGPSGNLRNSVEIITRNYRKDRKWFAAVGYSAGGGKKKKIGKDGRTRGKGRGYHQGLVEFGTGLRVLGKWTGKQERFASSFRFTPNMEIKRNKKGLLTTRPKPNKGFFISSTLDRSVELGKMKGRGNIPKTYSKINGIMRQALAEDMKTRVGKAVRDLAQWNKKRPL